MSTKNFINYCHFQDQLKQKICFISIRIIDKIASVSLNNTWDPSRSGSALTTTVQPITNAECLVLVAVWNRWSVAALLWYRDKCWWFPVAYPPSSLVSSRANSVEIAYAVEVAGGWVRRIVFTIADTTVNANLSIYCIQFSMELASVSKRGLVYLCKTFCGSAAGKHVHLVPVCWFSSPSGNYFELSGMSYGEDVRQRVRGRRKVDLYKTIPVLSLVLFRKSKLHNAPFVPKWEGTIPLEWAPVVTWSGQVGREANQDELWLIPLIWRRFVI